MDAEMTERAATVVAQGLEGGSVLSPMQDEVGSAAQGEWYECEGGCGFYHRDITVVEHHETTCCRLTGSSQAYIEDSPAQPTTTQPAKVTSYKTPVHAALDSIESMAAIGVVVHPQPKQRAPHDRPHWNTDIGKWEPEAKGSEGSALAPCKENVLGKRGSSGVKKSKKKSGGANGQG